MALAFKDSIYLLASQEDCPILTLDKDFRVLNHEVIHPF